MVTEIQKEWGEREGRRKKELKKTEKKTIEMEL
jgi:hypothetical protein